jgi:hypothetical protein
MMMGRKVGVVEISSSKRRFCFGNGKSLHNCSRRSVRTPGTITARRGTTMWYCAEYADNKCR